MTMTFDELGLAPGIRRAITDLGFEKPTPVQMRVIPFLMTGDRDLVALAQTGTGKTAAYGLPILSRTDPANRRTQTLVLCPTRELCVQITRDLLSFATYTKGVSIQPVYGGAPIDAQMRALERGAHIIVATPGRMLDMIRRGRAQLAHVQHVVLDEADEMLKMGFQEDLEAILKTVPKGVRTLLFSATMPRQVATLAGRYMNTPEEITVGERNAGSDMVSHEYYIVHARDRYAALKRIIDVYPTIYGLVFCRTRLETHDVSTRLMEDGYNADALHGDLSQAQRDRVMGSFRTRHLQLLVATDVAARGLDVSDLTHVINFSLPVDAAQYTHRSGRTGRAGKPGISVVIVNMREEHKIGVLERVVKTRFEQKRVPSGREVCAAQLHALLERVKQVDVDEAAILPYLAQMGALLAELPATEVLKRFVSLEFNRFLAYYKDAADLNATRLAGTERSPRGQPRERKPGQMTGFIVNLGVRNGLTPGDLIGLINRASRGPIFDIGRIQIDHDRSYFEASGADPRILTAGSLPSYKGRPMQIRAFESERTAPPPKRHGAHGGKPPMR
ncbi:MAG: DEAD/DEAH box helicase [Lentisphaerae bacterium]|nr:DEAD/DEAH box helicase [Lentisphaerota bacterium]